MNRATMDQIAAVMLLHGTPEQQQDAVKYASIENSNPPSHPSYDAIHARCRTIVEETKQRGDKYDLIIGLSRGGLLPGVILSHLMDVPFKPLEYSSTKGQGDKMNTNLVPEWIAENRVPQFVLLVDDIVDSGHTMKEVFDILHENSFFISTAAVYYKTTSVYRPDYIGWTIPEDFGWVVFPFEER